MRGAQPAVLAIDPHLGSDEYTVCCIRAERQL